MSKTQQRDTEKFLQTLRERFASAQGQESEIRTEYELDLGFVNGEEQWSPQVAGQRKAEKRPMLKFNALPTFVQQVANEARQNKPTVKFSPTASGAPEKTGKVFEGLARAIQYRSRADVAYETAAFYSTAGSFGAFRQTTDYVSDDSFNQEIRFEPILDPSTVYGGLIPAIYGRKPKWIIVTESRTRDEFKAEWPKSEMISIGFAEAGKLAEGWVGEEHVQLAEYWWTEPGKPRTMRAVLLPDGSQKKVYLDELPEGGAGMQFALDRDGSPKERTVTEDTIHSCLTNGIEILPGTETVWAGRRIPVYMVLGWQMIRRGKPMLFSLVRFMRDPQQLINVYKSGIAENIGLANRAPYIGFKGQFKDPKWLNANVKNYAFLEAEPVTVNGNIAPLPQRQNFEAAIQSLSVAAAQEIDDQKRIAGIFDAALGAQSNETSGIAIENRRRQSGVTNFHFLDNLARTQTEAGEELGYLIPRIYDTQQEVRIIGEDDAEEIVTINAPYVDPQTGEQQSHMLEAGKYDVTVSIGPTTATKRQEASELTGKAIQSAPDLMSVIGDIFFRNQDGAGSAETADRLKKWISVTHPGLIEDDQKQQPLPPQVQAQLQQSGQVIEKLTGEVNQLSEEIRTKRFEIDSRERIAQAQIEFQREQLQAEVTLKQEAFDHEASIISLREQLNILKADVARAHQQEMLAAAPGAESDDAGQQQPPSAGTPQPAMPPAETPEPATPAGPSAP